MSTLFNITRLYYNNFEITVEDFKVVQDFFGTYWHSSRRTCIGASSFIDDFLIQVEMNMKFMECYKDVIQCLWDWDNWGGKYAKWIDQCSQSSDEDIDIYRYEVTASDASTVWAGTKLDQSADCWPELIWGENPNTLPYVLQDNLISYIHE